MIKQLRIDNDLYFSLSPKQLDEILIIEGFDLKRDGFFGIHGPNRFKSDKGKDVWFWQRQIPEEERHLYD